MDNAMSNFEFTVMAIAFNIRDFFVCPAEVLEQTNIKSGDYILDYGCGTGSYSLAAAKMVGNNGMVYALDIQSLALKKIDDIIQMHNISNMKIIQSSCATGLMNDSIDSVILFDTFHMCRNKDLLLRELHRVIKTNGFLYFSDHHMKDTAIKTELTHTGLFSFSNKGRSIYTFCKI